MPRKKGTRKQRGNVGPKQRRSTSTGERVTMLGLMAMIKGQGYKCAITGVELDHKTATVDHTVPLKYGGANCLSNVQVIHDAINRMKGTLSMDEFTYWCGMVANAEDA
jgi:5-methylcytosine-specific restriction endonuclease McrA